jgi:hypothetical protein
MPTFVVSYDLKAPGKDYESLIKHLKSYRTWWHHLDSTWFIVSADDTTTIRDACRAHMDANDRVVVAAAGPAGAWAGIPTRGSDWLMKNL